MFNFNEYINTLVVNEDDEELKMCKEGIALYEVICEDAWLARAHHFGVAGALERHIIYSGGTLLANAERKLQNMSSDGVIGESYTPTWGGGTTNEDDPHINEEVSYDQLMDDQRKWVENLQVRLRTAAIMFVTHVIAHDELSNDLNQPSYGGIKAKAAFNKGQRENADRVAQEQRAFATS
jgi:hypothetical protein|tara:strand:+ start:51 stop:590 length:540 start_codon:yes stop_codon:yes gene_type:complete